MKLYVASTVLFALAVREASAYGGYDRNSGSFGGVVSGSSAQLSDDRYGNYNQLHGKHVHDYTYERAKHLERLDREAQQQTQHPPQPQGKEDEAAVEKEAMQGLEQPVQQQQVQQEQQQPVQQQPVKQQLPRSEQHHPGSAVNGSSPSPISEPGENKHKVSSRIKTISGLAESPINVNDARYGSAASTSHGKKETKAASKIPVYSAPSQTTQSRPGAYGSGYGAPFGGVLGTISGSSAQYTDDRYGNTNQLHGKHMHEYAYERMKHLEHLNKKVAEQSQENVAGEEDA
eukprot:CAMPEP_0178674192 /NCGR_PEP_ID=MMETSP0698-20121128/34737_1 /TAXON_ID=265572 /ORGANISM="Extubocellulus spinifer, Strain CCMP396" /LENGTH=287 /DNA_ID=CAMNT_0020318319 /DNA_START=76 /DNA_END=939 /DNA_ORIENTATION=-